MQKAFFINTSDVVLTQADSLRKIWFKSSIIWKIIDLVLAIGSFVCSIAALFVTAILDPEETPLSALIIIFSALAAIFTLACYACDSRKTSAAYRLAFQNLYRTMSEAVNQDGSVSTSGRTEIIDAINEGERIIGKTYGVDTDIIKKEKN